VCVCVCVCVCVMYGGEFELLQRGRVCLCVCEMSGEILFNCEGDFCL